MKNLIVPKEIEVLICSPGGVGTTFLIKHISQYKVTNNPQGRDQLKHIQFPPISSNRNVKYLFLFGNPIESVMSVFGRKLHYKHSESFLAYNKSVKPVDKNMSLDEYAREGIDRFLFERQFNNWINNSVYYPTLFLKYENIWDNLDLIYDYLDLPKSEIGSFPTKKARTSDFSGLNEETQRNLKKMYGAHQQYIDSLDDFFFSNEQKNPLFPKILLTNTFYYTLRRYFGITVHNISPSLSDYLEKMYYSSRT